MPRMIATHTVKNAAHWKAYDAERAELFAPFASDVVSYVDPDTGSTVALSFTLVDAKGLENFMSSVAGAEAMERHGVIQPVVLLLA